jgi:broad specificity phosphatase PhoE
MPRLYLVRHARPAAAWGEETDPGLDDIGAQQALARAQQLSASLPSLQIYTSPLRRCRETADPLAQLWRREASVLASVAEIPAPPVAPDARRDWLSAAMRGTWNQMYAAAPAGSIDYREWRRSLIHALVAIAQDSVIYTHFVAINVAAGAAQERDDVLCFRPDHASVTVLDTDGRRLRLVELGGQADTSVLTRQ